MNEDVNPFQSPADAYQRHSVQYRSGSSHAKFAIAFLALTMFGSLLEIGLTIYQNSVWGGAMGGVPINPNQMLFLAKIQGAVSLYGLVALLGSFVAFIVWFYRAYDNLPSLGIKRRTHGTGWTIGAWFIPIGNLIIPYQLMVETWNGSSPKNATAHYATRAPGLALVRWWWAAWLVMNFTSFFIGTYRGIAFSGNDLGAIIQANWLYVVSNVLDVPAGTLAIQLVRRIEANQSERRLILEEIASRTPDHSADSFELPSSTSEQAKNFGDANSSSWIDDLK